MNGRRARRLVSHVLGAGLAGTLLATAWCTVAGAATTPTSPTTITPGPSQTQINAAQAQVTSIEAQITQEQQQSEALSQQYDAAVQHVQQLQAQLAATTSSLAATRTQIRHDRAVLAKAALKAYVYGNTSTQVPALFTTSATAGYSRTEYENTAIGDLASAKSALEGAQARLANIEATQQSEQQQAQSAANQALALEQQNAAATTAAQSTLQQVQGTLASEVAAAAEAAAAKAAAAAAAAARAARQAAAQKAAAQAAEAAAVVRAVGGTANAATQEANQATAAAGGPSVTTSGVGSGPSGAGGGGGSGTAALQSAQSQLGVPYVWGGETPGVGFDCSGLTQWAWAQAGVSIPRTSQAQYADLPRVWTANTSSTLSLSSLQPGDLFLYYNLDGTGSVDHVAMYAGGDTLIQAPFTGTVVRYVPVYTTGLTAVAQP